MKPRIIFIILCFLSLNVMGQGVVMRNKKQKTTQTQPTKTTKPSKPTTLRPKSGTLNGHEWVDLGLSVKWATCNVGASSSEEFGEYYAWGEVEPKTEYTEENYKYKANKNLSLSCDAAHVIWGGSWRIPTKTECDELCKQCKWKWTGNGYSITGPNGQSIFLPAGDWWHSDGKGDNDEGGYWSSTISKAYGDNSRAYCIYFYDNMHQVSRGGFRESGANIRPVTK